MGFLNTPRISYLFGGDLTTFLKRGGLLHLLLMSLRDLKPISRSKEKL
jgi:hypothetical protein